MNQDMPDFEAYNQPRPPSRTSTEWLFVFLGISGAAVVAAGLFFLVWRGYWEQQAYARTVTSIMIIEMNVESHARQHQGEFPASASSIPINWTPHENYYVFPFRSIEFVRFDQRTPGDYTYVPIITNGKVTACQILGYVKEPDRDEITNTPNPDGSFTFTPDGIPDMVAATYDSRDP